LRSTTPFERVPPRQHARRVPDFRESGNQRPRSLAACVDIDRARIRQLEDGIIPIYEPGLADLVRRNERAGRLRFATEVTPPFDEADAYFIAVGTPQGPDGAADTSAVAAAAEQIAVLAKRSDLPWSS
jgi:UDPglucose 6-dehydrogenase